MKTFTASDMSKSDLILLFETLEIIEKCSNKDDYHKLIPFLNNLVPFGVLSHTLIECRKDEKGIAEITDNFQIGSCPPQWVERYFEQGYGLTDPIMKQNIVGGFKVQRWKDTYKKIRPLKQFQMEAEDFGLRDGLTIGGASIRKPEFSVLTLSGQGVEYNSRTKFIMKRFINPLHQAIRYARSAHNKPELTTQQKQVLGYLVRGLSQKMIADKMYLGPDNIKLIVSKIKKALDAENTVHSACMAMKYGEI